MRDDIYIYRKRDRERDKIEKKRFILIVSNMKMPE